MILPNLSVFIRTVLLPHNSPFDVLTVSDRRMIGPFSLHSASSTRCDSHTFVADIVTREGMHHRDRRTRTLSPPPRKDLQPSQFHFKVASFLLTWASCLQSNPCQQIDLFALTRFKIPVKFNPIVLLKPFNIRFSSIWISYDFESHHHWWKCMINAHLNRFYWSLKYNIHKEYSNVNWIKWNKI